MRPDLPTAGGGRRAIARHVGAVLLLALTMTGCGSRSEAEQLAALRDSFTYKRYRQVSADGLTAAIKAWGAGQELAGEPVREFTAEDHCTAHVLLAYAALGADRQTIAIAEADIVDALECDTFSRLAARSMRSVVYQRKEWIDLAREESLQPSEMPSADPDALTQMLTLHLVLIYSGVTEQDWQRVVLHVEGLGALIGQPWVGDIGRAGLDINEGRTREGLRRIKRTSQNPHVPEDIRAELAGFIDRIEAKSGDLDQSMASLMLRVAWLALQDYGPASLRDVITFVEDRAWAPLAGTWSTGSTSLKARWRQWFGGAEPDASAGDAHAPPPSSDAPPP